MPAFIPCDIGGRYGRLVVTGEGPRRGKFRTWACICDCGNTSDVYLHYLRSGKTRSCGCLLREVQARVSAGEFTPRRRHGLAKRGDCSLYRIWQGMIRRCYDQRAPKYRFYGGAGVSVCDQWMGPDGVSQFAADMGARPSPQHTLDRWPNPRGNYEPGNCRWATRTQQAANMRNNINVQFNGELICLAEMSRRTGVPYMTLRHRIVKMGLTPDEAANK